VYLIGNKSEMEDQREVTFQRALEFAKENKLHKVFETSAKTGYNVEEVFAMVAKELYMQSKREAEAAAVANTVVSGESGKGPSGTKLKHNKDGETAAGRKKGGKKGGCC
jgi:GTPase SAR1 family protein